jgi:dipeptidyl-peptidase 4
MNMKQLLQAFFLFLLTSSALFAQKNISLEDIWGGAFRTRNMEALQSLKNTNEYTVLNYDRATRTYQIDLYDFATLTKKSTLLDSKNHKELSSIESYTFNALENQMLIALNGEKIYRHSSVSDTYLYDIATQSLIKVADYKIQEPTFSPKGDKIAYAYQNNLYVYDVKNNQHQQITTDGKKNQIINGITDWVYEEEFGFVKAFQWNASGTHIAFIRFDETDVPEFSMDVYGTELYPTQEVFKYPKVGEKNAEVSLHLYNVSNGNTQKVDLSGYSDFYIARLHPTADANFFSIQVLNRHQNQLDLRFLDIRNGQSSIILSEKDAAYVDVTDHLTFLKDNSFIWSSEKDGFNHLYHYDTSGKLINQITKGNWEVTAYYGLDEKSKTIFYQSVERGSTVRDVYKIGLNGKNKTLLTSKTGTNKATFSPNFEFFINTYSSATIPTTYTLHTSKNGSEIKAITDNNALSDKLKEYNLPTKEFFTLKADNGQELNAYILKPLDFDANKKYPLLLFQYSGPGSQRVANQWLNANDYWHMMLAQQGYLVACVDGRGTGYRGAAFKKVTQNELGKYEVEDQIAAARTLATYPYIDGDRIGIWGWSYGGFMSSNCLLKGNDVFKMAIAVAPVTNWRFYDTIYTERYMQTPQENPSGYDDNSPINHIDKLKGKYLIIHGSADDNVHVQNAMRMIRALQLAGKDFDQAIYPDTNHGIYGGKIRLQLYTLMTNYIKTNL